MRSARGGAAPDDEEFDVAGVPLGEVDTASLSSGDERSPLLGVAHEEVDELAPVRGDEAVAAPHDVPRFGRGREAGEEVLLEG